MGATRSSFGITTGTTHPAVVIVTRSSNLSSQRKFFSFHPFAPCFSLGGGSFSVHTCIPQPWGITYYVCNILDRREFVMCNWIRVYVRLSNAHFPPIPLPRPLRGGPGELWGRRAMRFFTVPDYFLSFVSFLAKQANK